MKHSLLIALALLAFVQFGTAQTKSVDAAIAQSKKLRADKSISISYDAASNTSRVMLVADNFPDGEAKRAGILAMNFAAGFFFAGSELGSAPTPIKLTFWVKSKKPRFAEHHGLTLYAGSEVIEAGSARYAAKPRQNMEYLNFELDRALLEKIAKQSNVKFKLGDHEFTFTESQLRRIADLLLISDPAWKG